MNLKDVKSAAYSTLLYGFITAGIASCGIRADNADAADGNAADFDITAMMESDRADSLFGVVEQKMDSVNQSDLFRTGDTTDNCARQDIFAEYALQFPELCQNFRLYYTDGMYDKTLKEGMLEMKALQPKNACNNCTTGFKIVY